MAEEIHGPIVIGLFVASPFKAERDVLVSEESCGFLEDASQSIEMVGVELAGISCFLQFAQSGDVVEERGVLSWTECVDTFGIGPVKEILPVLYPAQFVAHDIEEERMMGGKDNLERIWLADIVLSLTGALHELGEVATDLDGVVVVERGNGVVDVDELYPVVGWVIVEDPLANGHEKAPNKNRFFTARDLDVGLVSDAEGHRPILVVDIEIKIGVAVKIPGDRFVQSEISDAIEEFGIGVEFEVASTVTIEIVVPSEKIFGESVEIKSVADDVVDQDCHTGFSSDCIS